MLRFLVPAGLFLLPLTGCGEATTWMMGGQDCSLVRWDRGQAFCVVVPPPSPPPFCSRALGGVDCWEDPTLLANRPRGLADNPAAPLSGRKEPGSPPPEKQAGPHPAPEPAVAVPTAPGPVPPVPAAPAPLPPASPAPAGISVPPPMPLMRGSHATDYRGL